MKEILNRYTSILKHHRAPVLDYLLPGISQKELTSVLRLHFSSLDLHQDLIDLYAWHGGTILEMGARDRDLFPGISFSPLWRVNMDLISASKDVDYDGFFKYGLAPIFLHDNYLSVDISTGSSSVYRTGPVLGLIFPEKPEEMDRLKMYDSLESMFETMCEGFEQGFFYFDENNSLTDRSIYDEKISREYLKICMEMNPQSDYWEMLSK